MKKLILLTALLFNLPYFTYTQFTSLPVRLVNSAGEPLTVQAGNIEFTKYPHNYPADIVSGLTITEHGTAGNYVAKGFSSFQYVKLWLGGVEQTWFDSVLTGNIFSWLSSNYVTLGTTQTISGSKFTSGNWTASSTGNWLYSGSSTSNTFYKPYIINSSPWYTDISLIPSTALLFRSAGDSLYVKRDYVYFNAEDNKLYLNSTGTLGTFRLAKRGNGQLFDMNTSQFYWSPETGLNLNSSVFEKDSIAANTFTGIKDSTWNLLGEPLSRYKFLSLKKTFWSNPLPYPDWKWYYKSVNESGVVNARDSFTVMNHADNTFDETPFEVFGSTVWSDCDTITLPVRGLFQVTYSLNLIFPYTDVTGIQQRDSAIIRVVNEMFVDIPSSYSEEWKEFYDGTRYMPESRTVTRTFTLFNSVPNTKYYLQLYGIQNTGLVNIAVTKPSMTYLLVR